MIGSALLTEFRGTSVGRQAQGTDFNHLHFMPPQASTPRGRGLLDHLSMSAAFIVLQEFEVKDFASLCSRFPEVPKVSRNFSQSCMWLMLALALDCRGHPLNSGSCQKHP